MKKSKLSETQIFNMLNETEAGLPVNDVCHKYHVANSTYYKMKAKYAGMSLSDLKRLKALEQENQHLIQTNKITKKLMCGISSIANKQKG